MDDYWSKRIKLLVGNNPDELSEEEYREIVNAILIKAPCKLLIFGCGRDSELYQEANKNGLTVFLEHNEEWLRYVQNAITIKVAYGTSLAKKWEYRHIENVPEWVKDISWDIIFVDAPEGYAPHLYGRLSSIKMASEGCRKGIIFVHDMHRENEGHFTARYLGSPTKLVGVLGVWERQGFLGKLMNRLRQIE